MADIDALADRVEAEFGELDLLFANAGINLFAPFDGTDEAAYDEVLTVNAKGPYFTVQKLAPLMTDGSAVVLTTSVANVLGRNLAVKSGTHSGTWAGHGGRSAASAQLAAKMDAPRHAACHAPVTHREYTRARGRATYAEERRKAMESDGRGVVHVPPDEGESLRVGDDTYTFKATAENTGGTLTLMEATMPPSGAPQGGTPPHIHHRRDQAFYVLEGEIEITDGERAFVAGAGSFLFVPRGTVYTSRNAGTGTARMLGIALPAGAEGFLREVGQPAGQPARQAETAPPPGPEEMERVLAAARKYGMEMLPPNA